METLVRELKDIAFFDAATLEITPEQNDVGFLSVTIRAARAGIMEYRTSDGKLLKYFTPRAEFKSAATVDSAKGIPATRRHPTKLLDSSDAKMYLVGATGDLAEARADDYLYLNAHIFDGPTIEAIKAGKKEVSMGRKGLLRAQKGYDPEFGDYDVLVTDVRYNHCALALDEGEARGGEGVRVLMDSKDLNQTKPEEAVAEKMAKIKLQDGEHEVTPELHDAIKGHLDTLDAQHKANHNQLAEDLEKVKHKAGKLEDSDGDLDSMAGAEEGEEEDSKKGEVMDAKAATLKTEKGKALATKIAGLHKQLVALKAEKATLMDSASPDKIQALATERAKIIGVICAMDSKAVFADLAKLGNEDLMKKAIVLRTPKATFEGMDSARIQGQFDMVAAGVASKVGESLGRALMDAIETTTETKTQGPAAWEKKPLSAHKGAHK